ncbi:MAG: hypothetical protein GXX96_26650 [Planctomycetaceae bacterium]|nr:hypothetical protein [Planctomycetaceae bacterium]
MASAVDTDRRSLLLRERSIDLRNRQLLVANVVGTEQEQDLTKPANCNGFGRIHHFRRTTNEGWPPNPLPIDPACRALAKQTTDLLHVQVFQVAVCNFACWYCYVPRSLLNASESNASWMTAADLVSLYLDEPSRPSVIDLSGGQPDLIPEWIPWMMRELRNRGLEDSVYLWSDDNLSTDFFWRFLKDEDIQLVASFRNYGKVCCFKGFNAESFEFNTGAAGKLFRRQFELVRRYFDLDIDLYGYATFTAPSADRLRDDMRRFMDDLQAIHNNFPLRVVPLEIRPFSPMGSRLKTEHQRAMDNQHRAIEFWQEELALRFSAAERDRMITEVPLT